MPALSQDDSGLTHVLEHLVLAGSQRYPVPSLFFELRAQSICGAMNALTTHDSATFHFATPSSTDFHNVLAVYLDTIFHPLLHPLDFAQEAAHPVVQGDPSSADFGQSTRSKGPTQILHQGVVLNEMRGIRASLTHHIQLALDRALFVGSPYAFDAGGDPAQIITLKHETLTAFHAEHYRPERGVLLTAGPCDVATVHAVASNSLGTLPTSQLQSPDSVPNSVPRAVQTKPLIAPYVPDLDSNRDAMHSHKLDAVTDWIDWSKIPEFKTQCLPPYLVRGWRWGKRESALDYLEAKILQWLLCDSPKAALLERLNRDKGIYERSEPTGVDDSRTQLTFNLSLKLTNSTEPKAASEALNLALADLAAHGFSPREIKDAIDVVEFAFRQAESTRRHPSNLGLLMRALPMARYGADILPGLFPEHALRSVRTHASKPDYGAQLVRKYLLENPASRQLFFSDDQPDSKPPTVEARTNSPTQAIPRTTGESAAADNVSIQRARELETALAGHRTRSSNRHMLPSLYADKIAPPPPMLKINWHALRQLRVAHLPATAPGMFRAYLGVETTHLANANLADLNILAQLMTALGRGGKMASAIVNEAGPIASQVEAQISARSDWSKDGQFRHFLVLSVQGLGEQSVPALKQLWSCFARPHLESFEQIERALIGLKQEAERGVLAQGHVNAQLAARASLHALGNLNQIWYGLDAVSRLRELASPQASEAQLPHLALRLRTLLHQVRRSPISILLSTDAHRVEPCMQQVEGFPSAIQAAEESVKHPAPGLPPTKTGKEPQPRRTGWRTNTNVNYCARAFPGVCGGHQDAPAVALAMSVISDGLLQEKLRVHGGAYGAGASYDADTASASMFSYRDPRLDETFADFEFCIAQAAKLMTQPAMKNNAVLSLMRTWWRTQSPRESLQEALFAALHCTPRTSQIDFIERVKRTTPEHVTDAIHRYLQPAKASDAFITKREILDSDAPTTVAKQTLWKGC